jgi:hypothetical protein
MPYMSEIHRPLRNKPDSEIAKETHLFPLSIGQLHLPASALGGKIRPVYLPTAVFILSKCWAADWKMM